MSRVLCIAGLHEFDADPAASPVCPVCGCRHVRLAPEVPPEGVDISRRAARTVIQIAPGRHRVGDAPTWLDDRKTFVEVARRLAPELGEADLKVAVERWFSDGR